MQLFYAPNIVPPSHDLSEEESRHCVRVLRLNVGDTLYLTDGLGNLFRAIIRRADPRRCSIEVVETITEYEKRNYSLTLAVAPTKHVERFEWFLEKATEAGVDRIVPLECDHSERHRLKSERARRVIVSAMKQSLKAYCPQFDEPTPFSKLVSAPFDGRKFIAHCENSTGRLHIGDALRAGGSNLILIGPEGDFSESEIQLARLHGFKEISFGASRLRTETAAVAAAVITAFVNRF